MEGGAVRSPKHIRRAIEDGLYQRSMKARFAELEAETTVLIRQKEAASTPANVSVHPNLASVYRKKVEELERLIEDAEHRDEAMELIRSLIHKIVLTPREGGGVDALLHGGLARILALCSTGAEEAKEAKPIRAIHGADSRYDEALEGVLPQGLFL